MYSPGTVASAVKVTCPWLSCWNVDAVKSTVKLFGGFLTRYTHQSVVCNCEMTFAVYLPGVASEKPVPVLYWLSGLTCTDENFAQKAGFGRAAATHGVAIVMPDTSPRGVTIEGADDSYDFGSGAGFYVDATEPKWAANYKMYSYVTQELPTLVSSTLAGKVTDKKSIFGHSMGGHGGAPRRQGALLLCSASWSLLNPIPSLPPP